MLADIAIVLLIGIVFGNIFSKMNLPPIIGMIVGGILISPNLFRLVSDDIINISALLRQIALVVILTRAGLSLNIDNLKKVGKSALLMSFVPASFEIIGIIILAPILFHIEIIDAAIMGAVLGAVSPAIVVPRMLKLLDEGYGKNKHIPELIMAGASIDDVFVIVFFTSFITLKKMGTISLLSFINIPISIAMGIIIGLIAGLFLNIIYKKVTLGSIYQTVILISTSFLLLQFEDSIKNIIPFSALISIITIGMVINRKDKDLSKNLLINYESLWRVFEIFLFVLVGISVNLNYVKEAGLLAVILIIGGLIFRMMGVFISLMPSDLDRKEKLFTAFAYLPKATVQAAIGPLALSMGIASGNLILSVSVIAILLTAPLGAILTDKTYEKLLKKS